MCLNPKKILNRSNHFNDTMPLYLTVNCGKCAECRSVSQNDWFVRAYYEWMHNKGLTLFYTLTFNNDNLPKVCGLPCFSKRKVQLFLKRLRSRLSEYDINLKYLITAEFGELYKRPHYHALFFVDSNKLSPYFIYNLIKLAWSYGFVKAGDNCGVVNSTSGISYVTKYITKDLSYNQDYAVKFANNLDLRIQDIVSLYSSYNDSLPIKDWSVSYIDGKVKLFCLDSKPISLESPDKLRKFQQILNAYVNERFPDHLQSKSLGYGQLPFIKDSEKLLEQLQILKSDGSVRTYKLPRSFKKLFFYDKVENENDGKLTNYVINDAGIKHALDRLPLSLQSCENRYKKVLLNPHLISEFDVKHVNYQLQYDAFKDTISLRYFISHIDIPITDLAKYNTLLRGRLCPFNGADNFDVASILKHDSCDILASNLLQISDVDFGKVYQLKYDNPRLFNQLKQMSYDKLPCFATYEFAVKVLESLDLAHRACVSDYDAKQEKLVRKTREFFKKVL